MASENTTRQSDARTAGAAETTQQMAPVPAAPTPPPPSAPESAPSGAPGGAAANGSPETSSAVKDGAVKAAAAALAAARSAAKKVQSAASAASGTGPERSATSSQSAPPSPSSSESSSQSAPRPQMHYSVGGVHGTAQQSAPGVDTPAGQAPGTQPAPQPAAAPGSEAVGAPRRVRLSVSRIDPWSIMKLAFLLSVAIGIMTVVATAVVWYSLNSLGTFYTVQDFLIETMGPQTIDILQFIEFERMLSLSTLIALVNIVLLTAIATIMAILYNITAALVGGIHVTLTDE